MLENVWKGDWWMMLFDIRPNDLHHILASMERKKWKRI
jgi:hypothetical protein